MTIARTEVLTAVSLGQAAAMKDAAKVVPDLQKMWISANDDRVRDSHEMLHGDIVPHGKEFDNGLQFPRDPSGPPEEVINCRCTWIMLPKDQMQNIDDSLAASEE
jgi:SPP1 gp7 family putative phage head morphogenesis protein